MRIKIIWILFFIITCLGTLYPADLLSVYKEGIIKIIPDPNFGESSDNDSLFIDNLKDLLVTPDGSIFVSNNRTHNFYKFSPGGKLIGTFGREGRGPGDLYSPGLKTCMDDKYLVFSEYPEMRKISVFDLSGKCTTTLRTKSNCFTAVGLKNGYIAYYSIKLLSKSKNGRSSLSVSLHIINMNSKDEIEIPFGTMVRGFLKLVGNGAMSMSQNFLGDVIIKRTGDGNLLAGATNSPDIKIYSPEGKLLKTFQLNIKPIPVTRQYIEKQREIIINEFHTSQTSPELFKIVKKAVEQTDFENIFGEYLPYYKTIVVDAEGNFLVFKWLDSVGKSNEMFQVYSPDGKYLCETVLDKGKFAIDAARNFQNMQFTSSAFYGIVTSADDEENIRLVKVTY